MNKGPGGQQPFLWPGWFVGPNQDVVDQEMSTMVTNPTTGQSSYIKKCIQAILTGRGLWL